MLILGLVVIIIIGVMMASEGIREYTSSLQILERIARVLICFRKKENYILFTLIEYFVNALE